MKKGVDKVDTLFCSIRNVVSYRVKTLRGIAGRRQGNQSQATPPQAEKLAKRASFFMIFFRLTKIILYSTIMVGSYD